MAAFPTVPQWTYDSDWELIDDRDLERADDGTAYGRAYFSATRWRFALVYTLLSQADLDTLIAHYEAHRASPGFDFTWRDGQTYTCLYPKNALSGGGIQKPGLYKLKVALETA